MGWSLVYAHNIFGCLYWEVRWKNKLPEYYATVDEAETKTGTSLTA